MYYRQEALPRGRLVIVNGLRGENQLLLALWGPRTEK